MSWPRAQMYWQLPPSGDSDLATRRSLCALAVDTDSHLHSHWCWCLHCILYGSVCSGRMESGWGRTWRSLTVSVLVTFSLGGCSIFSIQNLMYSEPLSLRSMKSDWVTLEMIFVTVNKGEVHFPNRSSDIGCNPVPSRLCTKGVILWGGTVAWH